MRWATGLFTLAICSLCIGAAAAWQAGGPTVAGELKIKQHRLTMLHVKDAPEGATVTWDFDEDRLHGEEDAGKLYVTGQPGSYRIRCRVTVLKEGKQTTLTLRATLVIEAAGPPPAPPKPDDKDKDKPQTKTDPLGATAKLRFGSSGCTATVIGPQRPDGKWFVLTANHCTGREGAVGQITMKDGRTFKVQVLATNRAADLSWMVTQETTPAEKPLPYAVVAQSTPEKGTAIWHQGYGRDKPGNYEEGTVTGGPDGSGQLAMALSVSPGDSGSGIFRKDTGELISVVCCTKGFSRKTPGGTFGGTVPAIAALKPGERSEIPDEEKEPACSKDCACGCNDGERCDCGKASCCAGPLFEAGCGPGGPVRRQPIRGLFRRLIRPR